MEGKARTDKAHSQAEANQTISTDSEKDSPAPLPASPKASATVEDKDKQSSDEDMSKRTKTPILESLERHKEFLRAENRRVQENLYDQAEGEMLLRNEDAIVDNIITSSRTSSASEMQRQFKAKGAISITAEIHAIEEEKRSRGGERRGGSSRAGSSRAGPSKSRKMGKKH